MPVRVMCTAVAAAAYCYAGCLDGTAARGSRVGPVGFARRASRTRMFVFRLLSGGPDAVSDLMHVIRCGRGREREGAAADPHYADMRLSVVRAGISVGCAAAVAIGCAGCTSGAGHPSTPGGGGSAGGTRAGESGAFASAAARLGGGAAVFAPPLPARSLPSPGCSTATSAGAGLTGVRTAMEVSSYGSSQLEAVDVASIPGGWRRAVATQAWALQAGELFG